MFLRPLRIHRPQLEEDVARLIALICSDDNRQAIPLIEIMRILGVGLSDAFAAEIEARGDIVLGESQFENTGPEIAREVRLRGVPLNLHIAPRLHGGIMRFQSSFQLSWEPERSVSLSQLFLQVELRHLDISGERIFIDFAGAADVFIDLR